jgi:hypothetical protein
MRDIRYRVVHDQAKKVPIIIGSRSNVVAEGVVVVVVAVVKSLAVFENMFKPRSMIVMSPVVVVFAFVDETYVVEEDDDADETKESVLHRAS